MTHKYINGYMCSLNNLTDSTLVPEEYRIQFVKWQDYKEGVDFEIVDEIAIPIIKAGQENLWDEALTAVPVRVHPMTENYFKNNFIIKRK